MNFALGVAIHVTKTFWSFRVKDGVGRVWVITNIVALVLDFVVVVGYREDIPGDLGSIVMTMHHIRYHLYSGLHVLRQRLSF